MTDNNTNNLDDQLDFDLSDEILVKDSEGHFQVIIGRPAGKADSGSSQGSKDDKQEATPSSIANSPSREEAGKQFTASKKSKSQTSLTVEQPPDHQLAPPPPTKVDDSKTLFFFDVEDEEEVKKIAESKSIDVPDFPADKIAADIVDRSGLRLSAEQKRKIVNILVSRLKQVRERHEAFLRLTDKNIGGGLSEEQAEELLKKTDEFLSAHSQDKTAPASRSELDKLISQADDIYEIKPQDKIADDKTSQTETKPSESSSRSNTPFDYQQAVLDEIATKQPELMQEPQFTPPPSPPADLPTGSDSQSNDQLQAVAKDQPPKVQPSKTTSTETVEATIKRKTPPPSSSKPRIEDVKVNRRLLGPIDELRYLSVDEFRRLGDTAEERIEKIKQKISILEEESFAQKIEGIKAWRTSPVYQLYLQIGRESMEQGRPVKDVIAERQIRGDKYLTWEEFTLISDLNQQLRF